MNKKTILFTSALFFLVQVVFPFGVTAQDGIEPIIDTQTRAVATNLGLFGGKPEDIAIDPTSNAVHLANMAPSGIYSSQDKGETWVGLPLDTNYGTAKAVEVDPSNGNVYALIGDSLLKSTNGGEKWQDITQNINSPSFGQTMLFAQNKLLIASNNGGVYISSNSGSTFSTNTVESGINVISLASSPAAGIFYAITSKNENEKLFKSTDLGLTWNQITVPSGSRYSVVGVNPTNTNHIILGSSSGPAVQSTDGGANWSQISFGGQNVSGNHVTFDRLGRIYLGIMYSDDNGVTWVQYNNDTPFSGIYGDKMAIDPNDEKIIFTNSNMGVAKSTDRTATWGDKIAGITSVKTYGISQANDKNIVWIAANGGLAKTADFLSSSPTWLYPVAGSDGTEVYAVWIKPDDSNIVLFGDHNLIKRSSDAGSTWTQVAEIGSGGGNIRKIVSVRGNSDVIYAAFSNDDLSGIDSGAVYKSTDGGATWTDTDLPIHAPIQSITVAKNGVVYAAANSRDSDASKGIFKYENGDWTKLSEWPKNLPATSVLSDPENVDIIYATADADTGTGTKDTEKSGFYKSTDGSATWENISTNESSGLKNINHLDTLTVQTSTTPNTLYLSGQDSKTLNGVIYKSSDAGATWGLFYTGLKQETFYTLLFDGLAVGNDRGLYGLKSKAKVQAVPSAKTVKKGQIVTFRITLKDAATKKKLKNRQVALFKKVGKKWKRIKRAKTNSEAKAIIQVMIKKKTIFQVRFKPKRKSDKSEYALSKSKKIKIKVVS